MVALQQVASTASLWNAERGSTLPNGGIIKYVKRRLFEEMDLGGTDPLPEIKETEQSRQARHDAVEASLLQKEKAKEAKEAREIKRQESKRLREEQLKEPQAALASPAERRLQEAEQTRQQQQKLLQKAQDIRQRSAELEVVYQHNPLPDYRAKWKIPTDVRNRLIWEAQEARLPDETMFSIFGITSRNHIQSIWKQHDPKKDLTAPIPAPRSKGVERSGDILDKAEGSRRCREGM